MAVIEPPRPLGDALHAGFPCPHCGGTTVRLASDYRGRGNFTHGGAHFEATAYEAVTPQLHCTCPGGPYWVDLLQRASPEEHQALRQAERLYVRTGRIRIPVDEERCSDLTPDQWRQFCIRHAADFAADPPSSDPSDTPDRSDPPSPLAPAPRTEGERALPLPLTRAPVVTGHEGGRIYWEVTFPERYTFATERLARTIVVRPVASSAPARRIKRNAGILTCSCSDYANDPRHCCVHTALAHLHEQEEATMSQPPSGRSDLTDPSESSHVERPGREIEVPRGHVVPHPKNFRTHFDPKELQELADSIKAHGILQALLVRPLPEGRWIIDPTSNGGFLVLDMTRVNRAAQSYDGVPARYETREQADANLPRYEIIAGERRFRAANLAGLDTLPVKVVEYTSDREALEAMFAENKARADLTPIEEARALQALVDAGLRPVEIAARHGMSESAISSARSLLRLPEPVQQLIDSGQLPKSAGEPLLRYLEYPEYLVWLARLTADSHAPVSTLSEAVPYANQAAHAGVIALLDGRVPFDTRGCQSCDAYRKTGPAVYYPVCLRPLCLKGKIEEDARKKREATEAIARQAREAGAAWLQQTQPAPTPAPSDGSGSTDPSDGPSTTPPEAPVAAAPKLPKLSKLEPNTYERLPEANRLLPGCKATCDQMGYAEDYQGAPVRCCFDTKCYRRLKMAEAKARTKAVKDAANQRWDVLLRQAKDAPGAMARRMLARRAAAMLATATGDCVKAALALAGLKWDPRLFSQPFYMKDGLEIQDLCETLPVETLALLIGALDARQDHASLTAGNSSMTPILDWMIGHLRAPSLEDRAEQVYQWMSAENKPHVNAIRASAGLPPLPNPDDPKDPPAPAAPAPPEPPTDPTDPSDSPSASPPRAAAPPLSYACAGCSGTLDADQVEAFAAARSDAAGAVLADPDHPGIHVHLPTGLAVDAAGALYCPSCTQSILPELWAERMARLGDLAPAELLLGDEEEPEPPEGNIESGADAALAPDCKGCGVSVKFVEAAEHWPLQVCYTGVARDIRGNLRLADGSVWCHECATSRVGCGYREDCGHCEMPETRPKGLANSSAPRTEGEKAAPVPPVLCCNCQSEQVPPETVAAYEALTDEERGILHANFALVQMESGFYISKTRRWYCPACKETLNICGECGRSALDSPALEGDSAWASPGLCQCCADFMAEPTGE